MSLRPCAETPKRSWPTRQGGERRSPWSRVGVRSKAAVKTRLSWLSPYSPECVEGEFSEVRQEFIGNSSAFAMVFVGWVYYLLSSSCSLLELLVLSPWPTLSSHLY